MLPRRARCVRSYSKSGGKADIAGSRIRAKRRHGRAAADQKQMTGRFRNVAPAYPATIEILEIFGKWPTSPLGQPRLAHPIDIMIEVLGVLVDASTFRAFNCETGIVPQHLRDCGLRLLKFS